MDLQVGERVFKFSPTLFPEDNYIGTVIKKPWTKEGQTPFIDLDPNLFEVILNYYRCLRISETSNQPDIFEQVPHTQRRALWHMLRFLLLPLERPPPIKKDTSLFLPFGVYEITYETYRNKNQLVEFKECGREIYYSIKPNSKIKIDMLEEEITIINANSKEVIPWPFIWFDSKSRYQMGFYCNDKFQVTKYHEYVV